METSFGDPAAEYTAVTEGVVVTDRSYIGRFRATGKDMLDLLNRLSSNKLEELPPGTGKGSILPTNKGRVIDLLHIFARDDHLLLLTSPQTRERIADDRTDCVTNVNLLASENNILNARQACPDDHAKHSL